MGIMVIILIGALYLAGVITLVWWLGTLILSIPYMLLKVFCIALLVIFAVVLLTVGTVKLLGELAEIIL